MTEHYTRATESILKFCERCRRLTVHAVNDGRVGRCTEHQAQAQTRAQQRRAREAEDRARQPELFS